MQEPTHSKTPGRSRAARKIHREMMMDSRAKRGGGFRFLGVSLWRALSLSVLRKPRHSETHNGKSEANQMQKAVTKSAANHIKIESVIQKGANHVKPQEVQRKGSAQLVKRIFFGVKKFLGRVENNRRIEGIKDFLLGGYQRLPRTPSFNIFSRGASRSSSMSIYSDANWNFQEDNESIFSREIKPSRPGTPASAISGVLKMNRQTNASSRRTGFGGEPNRIQRKKVIEKKLREFASGNKYMDDVLDIDEFLHYYSRVSCPFYVDILNKFVVGLLGENVDFGLV